MPPLKRHNERRIALIMQFSRESTGYDFQQTLELVGSLKADWAEAPEFSRSLCRNLEDHQGEIESEIMRLLEHWRIDRLGMVERALLKLAATEIMYFPEIPPRVTINEYIEMAKEYANENAPGFINGVLDRLVEIKKKPDVQLPRKSR